MTIGNVGGLIDGALSTFVGSFMMGDWDGDPMKWVLADVYAVPTPLRHLTTLGKL